MTQRNIWWRVAVIVVVVAIGIGLYWVNPSEAWFAPKCPFKWLTGWDCPACGSQRAIHQLLHLRPGTAFSYNPFLVVSLPYVGCMAFLTWFAPKDRFAGLRRVCFNHTVVLTYTAAVTLWWIARNIIAL